jgi:NDP-4-keto-2,6-dideoxyhexose 3-C-methyltransferase
MMLAKNSYDTVCHEHQEYYALRQILFMAEKAGLRVADVEKNSVNGGSFSIVVTKQGGKHPTNQEALERLQRDESDLGLDDLRVFKEFTSRVAAHRSELKQFLARMHEQKKRIFGYGASTKGNVILQYCGITPDELPCIAEVNQDKFGAFTPGTRIPIVSEEEATRRKPDAYLVFPWHFRDNILKREASFLSAGHKIVFPLPELEIVAYA